MNRIKVPVVVIGCGPIGLTGALLLARFGIPSLLILVVTGLWLAHHWLPDVGAWFAFESYVSHIIVTKLGLLALTAAFAVDARFRIIPNLSEKNLKALAYHIIPVTILSVLFVIVGVGVRTGGLF